MPPQTALLHALAAPLYWQAGAAVGLAQGYAYAAAEVCAALGLSDLERQFRAYVPPPKAPQATSESPAAAVGSSSVQQDQAGRPATVTGVLAHVRGTCGWGQKQQRSTGITINPRPRITACVSTRVCLLTQVVRGAWHRQQGRQARWDSFTTLHQT